MEVGDIIVLRPLPETEQLLHGIHCQRRGADRESDHDACRDAQAFRQQFLRQQYAQRRKADRQYQHRQALPGFPGQRDEHRHRADRDQTAEIIKNMRRRETRRICMPRVQEGSQSLCCIRCQYSGFDGGLEIVALNHPLLRMVA